MFGVLLLAPFFFWGGGGGGWVVCLGGGGGRGFFKPSVNSEISVAKVAISATAKAPDPEP